MNRSPREPSSVPIAISPIIGSVSCGKGQESPYAPLGTDSTHDAAWQRQCREGGAEQADIDYWREELQGQLPVLELPMTRSRPEKPAFREATFSCELDAAQALELQVFCRREHVVPTLLLLSAYQVLLHRYSGQEDIIVGCPIAAWADIGAEPRAGRSINTLPLRIAVTGELRFSEFLAAVRVKVLAACRHQGVSLAQVMESGNPLCNLSTPPLFQTRFNMRNFSARPTAPAELPAEVWDSDHGLAQSDLALTVTERPDGIRLDWTYNCELFVEDDIRQLAECYRVLLCGILTDPAACLGDLPLLSPEQRQRILVQWNDTAHDYPGDKCVHELFEEQAKRTPDAVAVTCEDQQLTYQQLNARANQLAHHLRKLGVGPEVLVGLCVERSLEMIVGLLGILKAGGAYVPLDPAYPRERLALMLVDTVLKVLLTQEPLLAQLSTPVADVVCMDRDAMRLAVERQDNPALLASAENIAYVIYTSGSTGRPKGAQNTHRGICNRLLWMQDTYPLTVEDRVLQKTPYSFDFSVCECLWPLFTGARLVLARPGGHKDPRYLVDLIVEQQITTLHFVPSMLAVFLEDEKVGECHTLKRVFSGGEALSYELQQRFFTRLSAELHNLYGPTEAAVDATFWRCRPNDARIVPIGKPIANMECYILDSHQNPVPVGCRGELHLAGVGLARGYLKRPELTAEKFIPHPFSSRPGARLYRTGDQCRWLPGGNIEFLGRLDDQVKLRGFRIELGEIEAVLRPCPGVAQVVVVLREDRPGDKRLVAYCVPREGAVLAQADLSQLAHEKLPEYMVPSAFIPLERLPLTPSGKLDRRALPPPDQDRFDRAAGYVAPRTALEVQLTEIWAEVLGLERVGIHDNFFFDLGGHSLLAMRVTARASMLLDVELPAGKLFEAPTIAALADEIHLLRSRRQNTPRRRIGRVDREAYRQMRRAA